MAWLRILILDVVVLGIVCAPCILILSAADNSSGVSPYISEVASHATNQWRLIRYVLLVCGYAMLLEGALRILQSHLRQRVPAVPLVLMMAVLYGVTHLKFNFVGCVYATSVGLITAWFFHRTQRIGSLVIWHACWELTAIGFVLLSGTLTSGDCRSAILFEYKSQQVEAGKLIHVDGWGWVDKPHLAGREIERLTEELYARRGQTWTTNFSFTYKRMFRAPFINTQAFSFAIPPDATVETCHAMAGAALIHACLCHEYQQSQDVAIFGTPLSAYSFEDLPTVLYSICATSPDNLEAVEKNLTTAVEEDLNRWKTEGYDLVNHRVRTLAQFIPLSQEADDLLTKKLEAIRKASKWVTSN